MESHARTTLLWGTLAILLVAVVAAVTFCEATAAVFESEACQPVLAVVRRVAVLFE
jgi:hypothetical protein